jgi:hypothetical protein
VESALLDPAGPAVVRLCAGTYMPLTINREVTLIGAGNGNGPGNTVFNGGNNGRVITIQGVSPVTLRNLRITGGDATVPGGVDAGRGGGIYSFVQLTMTDCTITGNRAWEGGGMFNGGPAQMTRCTISDNEAVDDGFLGGGIYNTGNLTLTQSRVTLNRTEGNGAGIFTEGGIVTLDDSDVDTNTANQGGGGIFATNSQIHLLNGSRITGNRADLDSVGAGVFLDDTPLEISGGSSITGNTPDDCFDGDSTDCPP